MDFPKKKTCCEPLVVVTRVRVGLSYVESVRGESCLLTHRTSPVKKACNDDNSGVRGINSGVVPGISPGGWLNQTN